MKAHSGQVRFALAAAIVAAITMLGGRACAQPDAQPNAQPNPYRTVENLFRMPEGRTWGSLSAVDVDPDGKSIWVGERCGQNSCAGRSEAPILKFDPSGKLLKSFGEGMLLFPHGIHVDKDGNVWVTDAQGKDGKGHQVFKFSPEGKVLMTLGKAGVAGDGPDTFNQPCDVVVAANGDIFVADGHGGMGSEVHPRIVKFSKDGKYIKEWGKRGSAPGEFNAPHALALDSLGRLFVGDRGNNRIQIFDQEGKFLEEWKQFSRPSGIFIDKNDVIYVADSESNAARHPGGWKRGIRIGSAKDGSVTAFIPDPEPDPDHSSTSAAEGVAADAMGNVYGAEVGPKALKKYVKTAPAASHLPRGTATDVANAEIQVTVQKTASAPVSDQAIRVVSIQGEYNVGIGVVHRAKTAGRNPGGGIEHSQITEVYHVIEGNGTLVTGGAIENPRETPPDSVVVKVLNGPSSGGGPIQNGVSRKIGPGDVVIIPPNTPHWFSEITSDQIVYLVVRVDPHKVLPAGYGSK